VRNSLSTFGQVLSWIQDRLSQVETNMSEKFHTNYDAENTVSDARRAIEDLLEHDETLKEEFIEAAEAEYENLARLIQSRNIPIDDELEDYADRIWTD